MGLKSKATGGLTRSYRAGILINVVLIVALGTALTVGIVAAVRQLSYTTDLRFDMNADRRFEIDPLAKQLLRDMETPVRITFCWGYDQDIYERVKDSRGQVRDDYLRRFYWPILLESQLRVGRVLQEWEALSPHVKLTIACQQKDAVLVDGIAKEMGIDLPGVMNKVIFRMGSRMREVPLRRMMVDMQWGFFASRPGQMDVPPRRPMGWRVQEELTATLRSLMVGEALPIGITQGLGGRVEPGTAEYTMLSQMLSSEGYKPVPVNLAGTERIPTDLRALIVGAPKGRLDTRIKRRLREYEERGGRLLLVTDPRLPESHGELLEPYGVEILPAVVRDDRNRQAQRGQLELESLDLCAGRHAIDRPLKGRVSLYLGLTRPLRVREDHAPGAVRTTLLKGSPYARTVPMSFQSDTGEARMVTERMANTPDPSLAMALERPASTGRAATRIVVLGTSGVFRPDVMTLATLYGNRDLILNALAWLTDRESAIGLTPRAETRERILSPARLLTPFTWVGVVGLPGLAALIGLGIYFLRRS